MNDPANPTTAPATRVVPAGTPAEGAGRPRPAATGGPAKVSGGRSTARAAAGRPGRRLSVYLLTLAGLAVSVTAVVLGWHGGVSDPTALPPGHRLSHATVVLNSAILVFREGLETILVLAAVTASFRGAKQEYRRPVATGGGAALAAGVGTWFFVVWIISRFHGGEFDVQAATGLPSLIVLLIVMNWFFHKIYWTGWISSHHKRRRTLLSGDAATQRRRMLWGLIALGFTSVYRECFEVVIFLQNLRELYGASVVLEGVVVGLLFTAATGVLTFNLHQRLPYRKMLIVTGALLLFVLVVSVGEEVNEMQLAGWIGTTAVPGLHLPTWAGTWLSLFNSWETLGGQAFAVALVLGSYVAAQHLRVRRPRRRSTRSASRQRRPVERAAPAVDPPPAA